jgi:UDP-N-acetyl-D-glucosamine/UDP-N-acetyl-D-galactosamine dehydrogenase
VSITSQAPQQLAVVGLGYVGLPLALALAKNFQVLGFDLSEPRIAELQRGYDSNAGEESPDLKNPALSFTTDPEGLRSAEFVIIAVPTPVGRDNEPDLGPLRSACELLGPRLGAGTTVVFESTVYPGCTEEECIPILEQRSGLKAHVDFGVGYSPERIDPGNPDHTLATIVKVISAGDPATLERLEGVYGSVVTAGVYRAPTIRTAEAAKVIENIQRDLNIALMNELSMVFHEMGLNTTEVLKASGTKWNFLNFYPGLVGGHCIPVDPYYLVHKAAATGLETNVILAGRHVNDSMPAHVVGEAVKLLQAQGKQAKNARVLVLGVTFKENIPDVRNSQPLALVTGLESVGAEVWVHDPIADFRSLAVKPLDDPFGDADGFDLVILAVPHDQFREITEQRFLNLLRSTGDRCVFMDLRGVLSPQPFVDAGVAYWQL